jgi:hypothetical protein
MTTIRYGDGVLRLEASTTQVSVRLTDASPHLLDRFLGTLPDVFSDHLVPRDLLDEYSVLELANTERTVEDVLLELRAVADVAFATRVYHRSAARVPSIPTGRLFVRLASGFLRTNVETLLDRFSLEILDTWNENEWVVNITSKIADAVVLAKALQELPFVEVAEPELATPGELLGSFAPPTDPGFPLQWHLQNTGYLLGVRNRHLKPGADARVVDAWKYAAETLGKPAFGSPEIRESVIDEGFDLEIADLSGPNKIVGGIDFATGASRPAPDLVVGEWHGTACAGLAVGSASGSGAVGVAPNCTLIPIGWNLVSETNVSKWFRHAVDQGASVISCSWKADEPSYQHSEWMTRIIAREVDRARGNRGCVVCFAAGNDGCNVYDPPRYVNGFALHKDVLAVSGCTGLDERVADSNYGASIAVCAPTRATSARVSPGIATSDANYRGRRPDPSLGYSGSDVTYDFGGTSAACAIVAGVCALVLSARPTLTAREVRNLVKRTARRLGNGASPPESHDEHFGYGCVNAAEALRRIDDAAFLRDL